MAWVLLLASAVAVLLIGLAATAVILGNLAGEPVPIGPGFWVRFVAACALTTICLGIRSLRWIFLLRRAETRIPIRDAYISYFAGLSLLFAPLLLGEIAVRASVQRTRGGVPIVTTVVVNLWERFLDLAALGVIAGLLGLVQFGQDEWTIALLAIAVATFASPIRRLCLRVATGVASALTVAFHQRPAGDFSRLAADVTWLTALAASVVAWTLPGVGFWLVANAWDHPLGLTRAIASYAASASRGLTFAPGGVIVAGGELLNTLGKAGVPNAFAALTVFADRLATVGVATALGAVFVLIHLRTAPATDASHFDAIADAYDVQIPEGRRRALLDRKTALMRDALQRLGSGRRGLDVGCGQGAYVARMRELGLDVAGIDSSAGQIALAARNVGAPGVVVTGSVLDIPAPDATYDFAYVINVLHHLSSVDEQRRAFAELFRVLRTGGVLFVHEINTRNILFRFYMGYVFPSLNCIDEGVERWLLPNQMAVYTDVPVIDTRYFTFLPDFLPQGLVGLLTPIERLLETSRFGVYAAHYMAVFQKKGSGPSRV